MIPKIYPLVFVLATVLATNLRQLPSDPWHGTTGNPTLTAMSKSLENTAADANALEQSTAIAYLINQHAKQSACGDTRDSDCRKYHHFMHKIQTHREYTIRTFSGIIYLDDRDAFMSSPSSDPTQPLVVAKDQAVQQWKVPPSATHHVFRLVIPPSTIKSALLEENNDGPPQNDDRDEGDDPDDPDNPDNQDNPDNPDNPDAPQRWCFQSVVKINTLVTTEPTGKMWYCNPSNGQLMLH